MSEYFEPIRTALRVFPFVAAAVIAPLMVLHYRRFGRVQPVRTLVFYSFAFYSIAALFLVILPLPPRTPDFVEQYAGTRTPQVVPFKFVGDLVGEAKQRLSEDPSPETTSAGQAEGAAAAQPSGPATWLDAAPNAAPNPAPNPAPERAPNPAPNPAPNAGGAGAGRAIAVFRVAVSMVTSRQFLQPFFNFLLLFPLGVYLRYFFKQDLKRTAGLLLATTLGFELLQFTGLLGLYPCAYRLFDVDDLLLNTGGGLVGFAVTPLLARVLPRITPSYPRRPHEVTLPRRAIAFGIDLGISFFLAIATMLVAGLPERAPLFSAVAVLLFDFAALPILMGGRTLGKALVRIRIARPDGSSPEWYRVVLQFAILFGIPAVIMRLVVVEGVIRNSLGLAGFIAEAVLLLTLFGVYTFPIVVRSDHRGIHQIWSGTGDVALPVAGRRRDIEPDKMDRSA